MSATVAVTVEEQAPFVALDTGDTIVGVGPGAESQFGPLVGSLLWDCFPGSEPLFKPYYDEARRTGEPVEFVQFYDGNIARIRAVPRADDRLELYWEHISRLDTLTLAEPRGDARGVTRAPRRTQRGRCTETRCGRHFESSRVGRELACGRRAAGHGGRHVPRARRRRPDHQRLSHVSTTTSGAGSDTCSGTTCRRRRRSTDRASTRPAPRGSPSSPSSSTRDA